MKNVNVIECEVYSRVCGYMRPLISWNIGKQAEFEDRHFFNLPSNSVNYKGNKDLDPDLINILDYQPSQQQTL